MLHAMMCVSCRCKAVLWRQLCRMPKPHVHGGLVHLLSHVSCAEQLALYEGAPAVAEAYALHDWPAERAAHTVQAAVHRLAILQVGM
jgi:hypothetical protein